MLTFEATAMGDTIYFRAATLDDAKAQLRALCGDIPSGMVEWKELSELPDGCEYAADVMHQP